MRIQQQAFLDSFIPHSRSLSLMESDNLDKALLSCFLGAIGLFVHAAIWYFLDDYTLAMLGIIVGLSFIFTPYLYRTALISLQQMRLFVLIALTLVFYFTVFKAGGYYTPFIFLSILIPLYAQTIPSTLGRHVWFGLALLCHGFIAYTANHVTILPNGLSNTGSFEKSWTVTLFGLFLSVYFIAGILRRSSLELRVKLDRAQKKHADLSNTHEALEYLVKQIFKELDQIGNDIASTNSGLKIQLSKSNEDTTATINLAKSAHQKTELIETAFSKKLDREKQISVIGNLTDEYTEDWNKTANETTKAVKELKKRGLESANITGIIQQTSKQLKLLSMNASIEATNAGEHGEGFTVVAKQVKSLAEKASLAATDITEINKAIQSTTESAARYLAKLINIIQKIEDIKKTIDATINDSRENDQTITRLLSEISDHLSRVDSTLEETNHLIHSSQRSLNQTQNSTIDLKKISKQLISPASPISN